MGVLLLGLRLWFREIREELIELVLRVGGHFSSSLGMVECIVSLLHTFDLPTDKIVYDISHQAYPHKVRTLQRRDASARSLLPFPREDPTEAPPT